eukprot:m.1539693 g.1539693  ORF g.1539693 m.1539693 type:complete len:219 (-) comp25246_c0_seq22:3428-4084(-)
MFRCIDDLFRPPQIVAFAASTDGMLGDFDAEAFLSGHLPPTTAASAYQNPIDRKHQIARQDALIQNKQQHILQQQQRQRQYAQRQQQMQKQRAEAELQKQLTLQTQSLLGGGGTRYPQHAQGGPGDGDGLRQSQVHGQQAQQYRRQSADALNPLANFTLDGIDGYGTSMSAAGTAAVAPDTTNGLADPLDAVLGGDFMNSMLLNEGAVEPDFDFELFK